MLARIQLLPVALVLLLVAALIALPGCSMRGKKKEAKADQTPVVTAKSSDEVAAEKTEDEGDADSSTADDRMTEAAPEPETEPSSMDSSSTRGRSFDDPAPAIDEEAPAPEPAYAAEEEPPVRPAARRRASRYAAEQVEEAPQVEEAAAGADYVVAKGDTISKIARLHNLSPRKLMEINHITDPRKLKVGQKLVIP
jgi:LysM repeat protein